ncbi:MAG: gliding motility-associated C-terminal domain-containing protein, partial [Paludibacteraceae bacterium]|nr:gliding motility-associated C-terminal domain-containing protein [Paludibacteraceae bacterium]
EYLQADGDNEVTTCHGDTIWVGNHFYTESGNYRDTIKTKAGCDSIVVSKFKFEYLQADGDNEVTTCHGDTIWVGNHFYTESGSYRDTIKTKSGCDSIVVLRLNVLPIGLPVIDSISICLEDSSSINGFHINGTNEILDTFKTEFGCDSTVIHIVSIKPQADTTFNYMICRGEPITVIDGNTFNTDTLYSTLMAFEGYECKVRTTINVAEVPTLNLKDTAITLCGVRNTNFELDSIEHATYRWEPTEGVSRPFDRATAISIVGDSATYKVHIDRGSCNDSLNVHFNYFNTSNLILTSGSHQDLGELETISLALCNDKQDPISLISPSIFDSENKYGTDRWYTYHKALHWAVYRDSISAESGIFSNTLGNTADSTSAPVLTQTGQSGSYYFVATDTTSNCSDTVALDLQLKERPRIAISLNGANRLDICEGSTIDIDAFVHVDSMNATITEQGWLFDGKPYNTTDSIFATADSVHFLTYFATNVCGTSRSDSTYFTSQGELTFADSLLLAGSDSAYQEMKKDQLTIRQAIEVNVHRPLNASDLLLVTNPHNKANVFAGSDAELELHTPQQLATIWWYRVRDEFDAISGTYYDANGNLYDALEQNDEMLGVEDIARVNAPFKLPLHALTQTGTYYAVVSDSICPAIHSNLAEITVTELIPTAITPYKRDNLNDTFMLGYPVQIYNRYGQLVHESDNGWNGTYRGLLADPGVYYYSLTMRDGSIRKGTIEVVDLYGKSTLLNKGWVVR